MAAVVRVTDDLRATLTKLPPQFRDWLRVLLVSDQADRDAAAAELLRSPGGADLAELIDRLTLDPDKRRKVVRLLGEIEAGRDR